ncbi:MAG TPA: T9SS type A sorting domain-containing protein [Acidobacteriota bacterium]|nr:T9SS type A sorting domain-containing protein [Acidobacteriota bacterium]
MNRTIRIWLLVLIGSLTMTSTAWTQGTDPNLPDTVWVDSAVAYTSGIGVVPIRFLNDELLSGVEITLKPNSPQVAIDSFSFLGGRLEDSDFRGASFNRDSTAISVYAFDGIPPATGLLGHLFLSYPSSISPQVVLIDSTTIIEGSITRGTSFTDDAFDAFVPQFVPGRLIIREAPVAFDSVWITDTAGERGQTIALDVNFFNEDDVANVTVALDYGSPYLQYDSVSFQQTRPLPPYSNSQPVQNQNESSELILRLSFYEADPLPAGSGIIASLYFTIDPLAPDTIIKIDTTAFAGVVHTTVTRTPAAGDITFTPLFTAGYVEIRLPTDVDDAVDDHPLPSQYALAQNYPNPFNPTTLIQFSLPTSNRVRIDVFNVLGRRVRRLVDRQMAAGVHEVEFDAHSDSGQPLASGVYFYRLVTDAYTTSRKMVLMK